MFFVFVFFVGFIMLLGWKSHWGLKKRCVFFCLGQCFDFLRCPLFVEDMECIFFGFWGRC